jgi:hypothetical protein
MKSQEVKRTEGPFLIRPLRCECTGTKYCELCQEIERLGGVKNDGEFAFPAAHQRAVAADLLGDRFGTRYFELS